MIQLVLTLPGPRVQSLTGDQALSHSQKNQSLGRGFYSVQANRTLAAMGISSCLSLPRSCPFPRTLLCVRASPPPLCSAASFSWGGCRQAMKQRKLAPLLAFQQEGLNDAIRQNYSLFISLSIFPSNVSMWSWRALEDEKSLSFPLGCKNRLAGLRKGHQLGQGHTASQWHHQTGKPPGPPGLEWVGVGRIVAGWDTQSL